jgi:hypothetical protein
MTIGASPKASATQKLGSSRMSTILLERYGGVNAWSRPVSVAPCYYGSAPPLTVVSRTNQPTLVPICEIDS